MSAHGGFEAAWRHPSVPELVAERRWLAAALWGGVVLQVVMAVVLEEPLVALEALLRPARPGRAACCG